MKQENRGLFSSDKVSIDNSLFNQKFCGNQLLFVWSIILHPFDRIYGSATAALVFHSHQRYLCMNKKRCLLLYFYSRLLG